MTTITIASVAEWNSKLGNGTTYNNTTITVMADLTFSSQPNIPYLGDGTIFEGGDYTLTFTYANHNGFVKLVASSGTSTVQNVKVKSSGSGTIAENQGGLTNVLASGSEQFDGTNQVVSCSYEGDVINARSGGICGRGLDTIYTNLLIDNCFFVGNITGEQCGGIIAQAAGAFGSCTLTNCYATIDTQSGDFAGGLCGAYAGYQGSCTLTNCYATVGEISNIYAGGLCGWYAGYFGSCTLTNCYASITTQSGFYSGGLCGAFAGASGSCTITNCYSTITTLSGQRTGGLCGEAVGYQGSCTITNCYSTIGEISGISSGGLCGQGVGFQGSCTLTNCYATIDTQSGSYSGGLCGAFAGESGSCELTNCYSTIGEISGDFSGGLCGNKAGQDGSCILTNCYAVIDTQSGSYSGGLCGQRAGYQGSCALTNCYANITTQSGQMTGGLCGETAGRQGSCTITNCYTNITTQSGLYSGGLCGAYAGESGSCTLTNCYANIDTLSGRLAGSIVGLYSVNITVSTVYVPSGTNAIGGDATPLPGVIYDLAPITGSIGALPSEFWRPTDLYPRLEWQVVPFTGTIDIYSASEWNTLFTQYNELQGTVILKRNLVFSSQPPIFTLNGGTIDGRGYTMTFNNANHNGLCVPESGTIKVAQMVINNGLADNSSVFFEANSTSISGKIVFENCSVKGDLPENTAAYINGITFSEQAELNNCYFAGEIPSNSGGLILSSVNVKLSQCFVTRTGLTGSNSGGLIGNNCDNCLLENCYYTGLNTGVANCGGLIGRTLGTNTIYNCYSAGTYNSNCGALDTIVESATNFPVLTGTNLFDLDNSLAYGPNTTVPTANVGDLYPDVSSLEVKSTPLPGDWDTDIWEMSGTTPILKGFQQFPWEASSYTSPFSEPLIAEGNCMLGHTLVKIPGGRKRIDELKAGDMVITGDNRQVPIKAVLKFQNKRKEWRPYLVPKGSLGTNIPNKNLFISKFHAYKLGGEWRHFECNKNFKYASDNYEVTYYNLELPNFHTDSFIANGLEVESWDGVKIFEGKKCRDYKWKCGKDKCVKICNNNL